MPVIAMVGLRWRCVTASVFFQSRLCFANTALRYERRRCDVKRMMISVQKLVAKTVITIVTAAIGQCSPG